jgi:PASTA domain
MAVRLGTLVPRIAVVAVVWVLASGTLTYAAERHLYAHVAAKTPATTVKPALVVPDIHGQAFVFAKGILEDDGFAWHVTGRVHGYPTNLVASQSPVAGTRVVDTGAPTIVLTLAKGRYADTGTPEDNAPYVGTATRLATAINAPTKKPATGKVALAPPKVAKAKQTTHTAVAPKKKAHKAHTTAVKPTVRPAAFHVAGAPKEPLDEISLPARARRLSAWLTSSRRPTAANQRHWLYQHAWIVTGATFGWWHGAAALRVLIRVDRRIESQWGIGHRSETVARNALAAVEARAR